jgi:hypothetical protein
MLLLECKADEIVARRLGRTRKQCLHHSDKGRVCNAPKRTTGRIGLIDEDPGSAQPPYLATLQEISNEYDLRVFEDAGRKHRVIVVRPRLEDWLIKSAQASGSNISDFGLSDRPNELHREINSKLPKLEDLLDELLQVGNPRIRYLQSLIR